jgi:hypothetical protein
MDIKNITKELTKDMPRFKQHGQYQMCLGSLIKALQKERVGLPVHVNNSGNEMWSKGYPGIPHSYYGYPADLAFTVTQTSITVAQFLLVCETAIRASFIGPDHSEDYYRDYIMKANTPVWISEIDSASKNGIVDVVSAVDSVSLIIKPIEEEEEDVPG